MLCFFSESIQRDELVQRSAGDRALLAHSSVTRSGYQQNKSLTTSWIARGRDGMPVLFLPGWILVIRRSLPDYFGLHIPRRVANKTLRYF